MKITREGLKGASSAITGAVGVVVLLAALSRGLPLGKALLLAMFCAVPFMLVEELFGISEHVRYLRANWRAHAAMMLVLIGLVAGWQGYQAAVGMDKEERVRTTLAASPVIPVVMLVMIVVAHRRKAREGL